MNTINTIKNTPLALVTGASRGIGRAIAEALAGAGYDLVLTCSRTLPELSALANSLEEKYRIHCTAQMADASDPVAMDQLPWLPGFLHTDFQHLRRL